MGIGGEDDKFFVVRGLCREGDILSIGKDAWKNVRIAKGEETQL